MSASDPAELLGPVDRRVAPDPAFADALLDRLLAELERPRRRLGLPMKALALAAALALLLAAIATATYLLVRPGAAPPQKSGVLTVVGEGPHVATVVEVLPDGKVAVVWHCPLKVFCGDLTSVAWSPDGRHVAFTLDQFVVGRTAYVGLHILDTRTGRDIHIPKLRGRTIEPAPDSVFSPLLAQEVRRLGCSVPTQVAWSPDGRRLAYACAIRRSPGSAIFTIRSDGTGRRRLRTGGRSASWPSWSPDGTRMAFRSKDGSIYVVRLDGSGLRLVARGADAPAWSPDGGVIAYESVRGVSLVTPGGRAVTPAGGSVAPRGVPAWSPDGSLIAVATARGVYVVGESGASAGVPVTPAGVGVGVFGPVRPAWYPGERVPGAKADAPSPRCSTCF